MLNMIEHERRFNYEKSFLIPVHIHSRVAGV